MNATFKYTGDRLYISLSIDGEGDEAVAKLVEGMTEATVSVSHESNHYSSYRDPKPNGIHVTLRRPEPPKPEDQGNVLT